MRLVRSTWLIRCTALLLIGAMLPLLFAPTSRAASGPPSGTYADWIRSQLRIPVDADVESALEEASATGTRSFDAFVTSFLNAYQSSHPHDSVAAVFTDRELSNEALISYLQRRYTEIGGEAALLRWTVAPAQGVASTTAGGSATIAGHPSDEHAGLAISGNAARPDQVEMALCPSSPACPQGP